MDEPLLDDLRLLDLKLLDLDEKLIRYWLSSNLPLAKRLELHQHLQDIELKRRKLKERKIPTNA
jgi:hypothetical protein